MMMDHSVWLFTSIPNITFVNILVIYNKKIADATNCLEPRHRPGMVFLRVYQRRWDFMTGLIQTSSEETRPRSSSPLIVFGIPSVIGPELASTRAEHSLLWRMSLYTTQKKFRITYYIFFVHTILSSRS